MNPPSCDFLVSGRRYFGWYDPARGAVVVIDRDKGPYYGISWSSEARFVLARNGGKGELILVFDPCGRVIKTIRLGRDIDGHQIHFAEGKLHVTATRENAMVLLDPDTESQSIWNWTGHDKDVNHINGIGEAGPGHLWA